MIEQTRLDQLITRCAEQHQHAIQQERHWATVRIRTEGALMALNSLKESDGTDGQNQNSDAQQPEGDEQGASSLDPANQSSP